MKILNTKLKDCLIIEPKVFGDDRGFFLETFQAERYSTLAGINLPFVQDNYSRSSKGVLRGLHFQKTNPQGKLVRVVKGAVYDVAVDIRHRSPTFGQWEAVVLSEENKTQFWVPPGFAHGFVVLSEIAIFSYKVDNYYNRELDRGIAFDDPALEINWKLKKSDIKISDKDIYQPSFDDIKI